MTSDEARGFRYEDLGAFVTQKFGISLERYAPFAVRSLLASLPKRELDATAICRIIAACSIGETMFMRHPEQLSALSALAPSLPSTREGRPLRVWSAGCATGEEAYSLAATLETTAPVSVLATDLNPAAIERARAGRYRLWSMRGVDPNSVADWLQLGALEVVVRERLRPLVDFRVHNLMDPEYPADLDVIVCRNVLLYFDEEAAAQVLHRFAESLLPGGILITGYVDPEPPSGKFAEERATALHIYRRIGAPALKSEAIPEPATSSRDNSPPSSRRSLNIDTMLSLARGLSGERSFDEALAVLERLAERYPLRPDVYVLTAMVADEAGQLEVALSAARKAVFLEPDLAIGHYLIASCMERIGECSRAATHFASASRYLAHIEDPHAELPFGEGLTAAQLRRMIDVRYDSG